MLLREILEWILSFAAAVAVALPVRAFLFQLVRVEGASMNDTLAGGEIMFVSRFDYASVWLCLPWQSAAAKEKASRFTTGGSPDRFDVVICRYPGRGGANFVKRIVGLPGETVELREGYLYIDGARLDEPFIRDEYRRGWRSAFGPFPVPEDHYFVLGDHRNNSRDSRSAGALPRSMIMGHARSVVFPFRKIRKIR